MSIVIIVDNKKKKKINQREGERESLIINK